MHFGFSPTASATAFAFGRSLSAFRLKRASAPTAYDSLLICGFPASFQWMGPEHYAKFLSAATGIEEFADKDYILRSGERIYTIERAFNARDGFARQDDFLPERFIKEPIPDGPCKGQVFEMNVLLDDYYQARGWDVETGLLTEKKMYDLELQSEAAELKKMEKLKAQNEIESMMVTLQNSKEIASHLSK